jgi:hypothetical protein
MWVHAVVVLEGLQCIKISVAVHSLPMDGWYAGAIA